MNSRLFLLRLIVLGCISIFLASVYPRLPVSASASGQAFKLVEKLREGFNPAGLNGTEQDKPYRLTVGIHGEGTVTKDPDRPVYQEGMEVSLTALPAPSWSFNGWSGDLSGSQNPASLVMDSDKSVTANFTQDTTYSLSVNTNGSGSVTKQPDKDSYEPGEEVELTANPAAGWSFDGWSGDLSSSQNLASLVMDGDKSVTAHFTQDTTYSLSVSTNGSGSVTKQPDKESYQPDEEVSLTANPAEGWSFDGWSGDLSGSQNPASLVMDSNKSVTAHFTQDTTYSLSVSTSGSGSVTREPQKESYQPGEEVQLTANPAEDWGFNDWSGDLSGSQNPASLTMNDDKQVTANFSQTTHTLAVNTNGSGSVTRQPDKDSYQSGEEVGLTANPAEGWSFDGWSGDLSGGQNPATLVMDSDKSVTANFSQNTTYSLSVSTNGSGSVTREPQKDSYQPGEEVQLTANPAAGWNFDGWSGDLSSGQNPATLVMDGNKSVTANFSQNTTYSLSVSTSGSGSVSKQPDKESYQPGEEVQLTANPAAGWSFDGWSGDLSGGQNPATLVIDSNKSVTASFSQKTYTLVVNTSGSGTVTKNPDKTSYQHGETVSLSANPDAGWSFSGWSGDLSGSQNPASLVMDGNKSVTASFSQNPTYSLSVSTSGSGSVTKQPDQESYQPGEEVQLTASAAAGWSFDGWSGDLSGGQNPASLVMDGNKNVTAHFSQNPTYSLSVSTSGSGSVTRQPQKESYQPGEEVQLTANPAAGWNFDGWSGDLSGGQNPATLVMDSNKSVTASFSQKTYTLVVNTSGSGTVTKNPDKTSYQHGETVSLAASPASGWSFSGWGGDLSGSANPATLTMNEDKQVSANFTHNGYILNIGKQGEGSVIRSPDKTRYSHGETVNLRAQSAQGWIFNGWSGDLSGGNNPIDLVMDGDKNVTAIFKHSEYTLNVNVQGSGTVTKDPDQPSYHYGDKVTLTATHAPGWSFMGWSGDLSSGTNPVVVNMDGDKQITALFKTHPPESVALNTRRVAENQPAGTIVGSFSTGDDDEGDSHTYLLVAGEGDGDNGSFTIDGSTLRTKAVFDYETKNSYSIRVRTTDISGISLESQITISITNVNEAPSALADPYSIGAGNTLNVPAPGVLQNDSDPDGDPLQAILDTPPANAAQFKLNADGSFTYQPKPSFTGPDSFSYHASDGSLSSNTVTVEIQVFDESSPQVEWMQPVADGAVYEVKTEPVLLAVDAHDDVGIEMVRFYRWDALKGEFTDIGLDNTAPYQWEVDPGILNTGWNQVFAKAYDSSGKESGRPWIWLKVQGDYKYYFPILSR